MNARDYNWKAPLHIAAEKCEESLLGLLLKNKADTGLTYVDGNTPLDIAAKKQWKQSFVILIKYAVPHRGDDKAKRCLKKAMAGQPWRDELAAEQLQKMSPFRCVPNCHDPGWVPHVYPLYILVSSASITAMLKSKESEGKGDYLFLQDFASNNKLKVCLMPLK